VGFASHLIADTLVELQRGGERAAGAGGGGEEVGGVLRAKERVDGLGEQGARQAGGFVASAALLGDFLEGVAGRRFAGVTRLNRESVGRVGVAEAGGGVKVTVANGSGRDARG